jgi:hypothetical protein
MQMKAYMLIAIGGTWLLVAASIVVSNVILRETVIGILAQFIDKLPPPIPAAASTLFWYTLLFGWIIPVIFGLRILRRRHN